MYCGVNCSSVNENPGCEASEYKRPYIDKSLEDIVEGVHDLFCILLPFVLKPHLVVCSVVPAHLFDLNLMIVAVFTGFKGDY